MTCRARYIRKSICKLTGYVLFNRVLSTQRVGMPGQRAITLENLEKQKKPDIQDQIRLQHDCRLYSHYNEAGGVMIQLSLAQFASEIWSHHCILNYFRRNEFFTPKKLTVTVCNSEVTVSANRSEKGCFYLSQAELGLSLS